MIGGLNANTAIDLRGAWKVLTSCRGVYPPNTLEQVPPPLPLLPPFPLPSLPLPLEVGPAPLIAARGSGGAL